MTYEDAIRVITRKKNAKNLEGMRRFGINTDNAYGSLSLPEIRKLGKQIGIDHGAAIRLWSSGIHEARILASVVDDPKEVTADQMDRWASDFDSWDVCDQCCSNLFDKVSCAYEKAVEWSGEDREFVKRAGYVMMAALSVHDKAAGDDAFISFLPIIEEGATDERNFVKKAVNWALRQIGKRNMRLNALAIKSAKEIGEMDSASARWIASDALRELRGAAARKRASRGRTIK
jgi:3-methyladenine DNA glycosylase AlkD